MSKIHHAAIKIDQVEKPAQLTYCDLCGEKVPDTRELERDGQVYQVCEDCWSELEDGK